MANKTVVYKSPRLFHEDLACKFGLDVSVFVTGLSQLIAKSKDRVDLGFDGEMLVLNGLMYAPITTNEFLKEFPWWSRKQLFLIKSKALKAGLIRQDRFNQDPMDRRLWYAITDGD